jgi:hypothetical protein
VTPVLSTVRGFLTGWVTTGWLTNCVGHLSTSL